MRLFTKLILLIFLITLNVAGENNISNNNYYLSVKPSFETSYNINFGFPDRKIEYDIDFLFKGDFDELREDQYHNQQYIDYQYFSGDVWIPVEDTMIQIIDSRTRKYPIDYNFSFSIDRKKINPWRTYREMDLSNYWGAGIKISETNRSYEYERVFVGNVEYVSSETFDGYLFNPDTMVIDDKYQDNDKSTNYGLSFFYGIKLEYTLASIFGTAKTNSDIVFELDCQLITLSYSKSNNSSDRIFTYYNGDPSIKEDNNNVIIDIYSINGSGSCSLCYILGTN